MWYKFAASQLTPLANVLVFLLFFACFPLMMCSQQKESLKEKFEDYFLIGATINQEDYQLIDKDEKVLEIVSEEFNSVTPENSMKWMHSHPEYTKFTFSNAQKITDFAPKNPENSILLP